MELLHKPNSAQQTITLMCHGIVWRCSSSQHSCVLPADLYHCQLLRQQHLYQYPFSHGSASYCKITMSTCTPVAVHGHSAHTVSTATTIPAGSNLTTATTSASGACTEPRYQFLRLQHVVTPPSATNTPTAGITCSSDSHAVPLPGRLRLQDRIQRGYSTLACCQHQASVLVGEAHYSAEI